MRKSSGSRFFVLGFLVLLMSIPVFYVGSIIDKRADYNREARNSVGHEWGGRQTLGGPVMVIPVEETITVRERRKVLDASTGTQLVNEDGEGLFKHVDVRKTVKRDPVYLYPGQLNSEATVQTEERRRGIFTVPVYSTTMSMRFDFPAADAKNMLRGEEKLIWDQAEIRFYVSTNKALRGVTALLADGQPLSMEPLAQQSHTGGGVRAATGDPRKLSSYDLTLGFNGAETLSLTPVGRESRMKMTSDWPHPEFYGAFLPDDHKIDDAGFTATWTIPHLARPLPQITREPQDASSAHVSRFGVRFYQPNDFYQKAYRAARYGILFIGLTFLTIFLIEGQTKQPTHPVQYLLVGLAQSAFFLLMLSLAEQVGFGLAYLVSAAATVALVSIYGAVAMKLGRRSLILLSLMALLYAVLYLILRSADYALLAGSVLLFGAIAGTMYATRNENWYGEERKGERRGWFRRPSAPQPQQPSVADKPA